MAPDWHVHKPSTSIQRQTKGTITHTNSRYLLISIPAGDDIISYIKEPEKTRYLLYRRFDAVPNTPIFRLHRSRGGLSSLEPLPLHSFKLRYPPLEGAITNRRLPPPRPQRQCPPRQHLCVQRRATALRYTLQGTAPYSKCLARLSADQRTRFLRLCDHLPSHFRDIVFDVHASGWSPSVLIGGHCFLRVPGRMIHAQDRLGFVHLDAVQCIHSPPEEKAYSNALRRLQSLFVFRRFLPLKRSRLVAFSLVLVWRR